MSNLCGEADEHQLFLFKKSLRPDYKTGAGCSRHSQEVSTHGCDIDVSKWYLSAFVLESHHT
jgi:hypothetical protein